MFTRENGLKYFVSPVCFSNKSTRLWSLKKIKNVNFDMKPIVDELQYFGQRLKTNAILDVNSLVL